ncbi:hypothetical protein O181_101867 [Austropuccinia psidii MF-1]|uniref:Uncharacterized protein n=1 Tax=Austropuccinia psidii MF-1 TaxID=1389203 RepID=A0A9Q3JGU4_9BASI|nr:hypothetical protein [Austropuccinia psidii MF-1]
MFIGTECTQESAISQRKVSERSIISETQLELSISTSKRDKSHSEGSDGHLNQPVQTVSHGVQGQILENVTTKPQRSDELLTYCQNSLKEKEIYKYSNGWNPLSSKPPIEKIEAWHKKDGCKPRESPNSFYHQTTSQPNFLRLK